MSNAPPGGPPVADEKKPFGKKIFSRMKSVLRRTQSSSRTGTVASTSAPAPAGPTGQTSAASLPTGPAAPIPDDGSAEPTPEDKPVVVTKRRTPDELERARKFAQRFNIELEPRDWNVIEVAERVEKPIRMRIHRTCHRCNATFGANKVCTSCAHHRCEQCPRYPKKKSVREKEKGKMAQTAEGISPSHDMATEGIESGDGLKRKSRYVLTKPSRTGGQDLVRRRPTQRVRRTCHHCGTCYRAGNNTCSQCSHIRCDSCLRDPPKREKYPHGYPGDVSASSDDADAESTPQPAPVRVYRAPKQISRYVCHSCREKFKPGEKTCSKCAHVKCTQCPRLPRRKIIPEPDPAVLRRVNERLQAMAIARNEGGTADAPKELPKDPPERVVEVELPSGSGD